MALSVESYDNRPEAVAFAFGRVWYAGTETTRWGTTLFYSQVLLDVNRAGKCYQDADPTAEQTNSLIDSDGGTIRIPDMGKVLRLVPLSSMLIIVAENGIWSIRAGSDGFTPLSYFLDRVTVVGCVSKRSVVEVEDTVIYAALDGIYQVAASKEGVKAVNISEPTIDSYYTNITASDLAYSVSMYDYKEKTYRFFYGSQNRLDKCLNLRLKNGAWYPWSFDLGPAGLNATHFMTFPFYSPDSLQLEGTKFLMHANDGASSQQYAIMEKNDRAFQDFGEADISAHMEMIGLTLDNPQHDKQVTYMTNYFEPTETKITSVAEDGTVTYNYPSSALLTPKWEWSTSAVTGKQGRQRQVYRFREVLADDDGNIDIGQNVVVSKGKLRGEGKAISLRYDTESGKDMRFIGVTLAVSMDGSY